MNVNIFSSMATKVLIELKNVKISMIISLSLARERLERVQEG
jgi:hypothetical protein